ncbi:MAG: hypothetical protein KAV70_02610 [Bacteroidales bacterium]|jgi:hypothetical protein|nr:hypothetical protein [Bacteroidales bacterium]
MNSLTVDSNFDWKLTVTGYDIQEGYITLIDIPIKFAYPVEKIQLHIVNNLIGSSSNS